MKDRITVFSIDITIKIPLRFIAFRHLRCSTVKIGSQREKLSPKNLIIPRVRLYFEFGSFFIYATIFVLFVDFRVTENKIKNFYLFPVLPRFCRKAKIISLRCNEEGGGKSK